MSWMGRGNVGEREKRVVGNAGLEWEEEWSKQRKTKKGGGKVVGSCGKVPGRGTEQARREREQQQQQESNGLE